MFGNAYDKAWKQIIAPKTNQYVVDDLGEPIQFINGTQIERTDFELKNVEEYYLDCSLYKPMHKPSKRCLIYLHSHSGNRLEGFPVLRKAIPDFNVCLFDFAGCGMSDGKYVTLGIKESRDIHALLHRLLTEYGMKEFYFWGRSMGAVSAIMYSIRENRHLISGMILDSPFTTAKDMVRIKAFNCLDLRYDQKSGRSTQFFDKYRIVTNPIYYQRKNGMRRSQYLGDPACQRPTDPGLLYDWQWRYNGGSQKIQKNV